VNGWQSWTTPWSSHNRPPFRYIKDSHFSASRVYVY